MTISPSKARIAAAALLLSGVSLAGVAAFGQDSPESLLPPGFNEPVTPAPQPQQPQPAQPSNTPAPLPAPGAAPVPGLPVGTPLPKPTSTATPEAPTFAELQKYELPDFAKRSLATVGAAGPGSDGLDVNAFGRSDGQMLETLMRRMNAPVASRWLSIALRRALLSYVNTPPRVNGADFAAERAWLLLRMGEANAARGVVQSVDVADYTPKMFQVAQQVALATADPAAMCPLVEPAKLVSREQSWNLAAAMCAGLSGDPSRAVELLDAVRARRGRNDIDVLLAEKVVGAGSQGRRAVTVEWAGVSGLTAWRYGLATATASDIPDELFGTAGPQVRYWRAVAPMPEPRSRIAMAEAAAAQGIFSNAGLVDLYGEVEAGEDGNTAEVAIARDLRTAYTAQAGERLEMMRQLWGEPKTPQGQYARLVLTARAAARITPSADHADDMDRLIASMLSAGLDLPAMKWRPYVARGTDAWAMLALADPRPAALVAYGDADAYRGSAAREKAQMLVAGLAGLGRLSPEDAERLARSVDLPVGAVNPWTRAIDAAAERGEPGTVLLLAAVGMQTSLWQGVPPLAIFHIVSALRRVGLEGEARMIAAEAIARR